MQPIRSLLRRLGAMLRRDRGRGEIDDEFRFHLEMETEAGLRRGLGAAEARTAAHRAFGGVDRFREEVRDERRVRVVDELRQDVRYAVRVLLRNPLFSLVAVVTLALGIGANTAIFSVVNAVLLRPLPFIDAERLVMVWETDRASETYHEPASLPDIRDFQERTRTLASLGGLVASAPTLMTSDGEAQRLNALVVDDEVVSLMGVRTVVGRPFTAEEASPGGPAVALLSEAYWREVYGGDPGVVGRTLGLDGVQTTVIGVLGREADLGVAQIHARADYSTGFDGVADLWLPLRAGEEQFPRQTHPFLTVGRLAPGASLAAAQQELSGIAAELEAQHPENAARGVNLESFGDVVFGPIRPALAVLLGAVGLVLLITCANVANLLLVRTTGRAREVAVRRALGAATGRVGRQFLVESLILTGVGALTGVTLAYGGLRVIVALAPSDIPRIATAGIDVVVLAFTAAIATIVAIAFAMLPVWHAARLDVRGSLHEQPGRRMTEGRAGRRFRSGLVVAEVALAVMLVISAGLLLRSFWQLRSVDPGFRASNVLKAEYRLPPDRYPTDFATYPDWPRTHAFNGELLRRVAALAGVEAAALTAKHPLDIGFTNSFAIVGREAESADFPEIRTRMVSPGYLSALEIPLLDGRDLVEGDDAAATPVILINRAGVDRFFGGTSPLGQQISFWGQARQIVGVIGDERFAGLDRPAEPAVYAPLAQAPQTNSALIVRASATPGPLVPALRGVVRDLDPGIALYGIEPLEATLSRTISEPRFTAVLLALFGGIAVALALVGVHGVLSYTVAQRTHELGIRLALGATRGEVLGMVLRQGMGLAGLGIVLGIAGAFAATRLLAGMLFGVSATDAATFVAVTVAVALVALLASWLPARRVTAVSPMTALRTE